MAKARSHTGMLLIFVCIVLHGVVSVRSEITDIRLIGGPISSPNSGRVEVQIDGEAWLPVCGDGDWNSEDGVIACRQLGYTGYSQTRIDSYYGEETAGPGSVNRFRCRKENNNLAECDYEVSPTGCGVRNGAGLICTIHLGFCPDPGVSANSHRTTATETSYRYGVLVQFACGEGFELVGAHSIQCLFDNTANQAIWTESPPNCTEVVPTEDVEVNVPTRTTVQGITPTKAATSQDPTTVMMKLESIRTTLTLGITEQEEMVYDTTMLTLTTEKTGTKDSKYGTTMLTLTTKISENEQQFTPKLVGQGGLTTGATVGLAVGIPSLVACLGLLVFVLMKRSCASGKSNPRRRKDTTIHFQQKFSHL
ncbi:uncharacterized protein [Asterias amurensis]|uniref:uncharacterized protein isoform X2 n=1 Tax=Asterias amurensis TaxID=7602 RepID=UPI003AB24340